MNRFVFFLILILLTVNSCNKTNDETSARCPCTERELPNLGEINWSIAEDNFVGIEGISFDNYPKVDCSTSARELNRMVACKLLGVRYMWNTLVTEWFLQPACMDIPEQYDRCGFFWERIMTSQTHGAFMNLINNEAEIIFTHRTISLDEKVHADNVGITLIETPIALDAFVFVVNSDNQINSLTIKQIQDIYTKKISSWSQVGGKNEEIKVFTRPRNSGSEEVFRTLVMDGLEPADFPEAQIGLMAVVFSEVINDKNSICYSFNTYKDLQARVPCNEVPVIAINGICPDENTVKNGTYPLVSKVHVAIRSDLDRNSMAYKLYEWLQLEHAKYTITECGFIPK
jgi:phosphate transport system substrate-binding protein